MKTNQFRLLSGEPAPALKTIENTVIVTQGVPFAYKDFPMDARVCVADGAGTRYPTQATVLAFWTKARRYAKWVLLDIAFPRGAVPAEADLFVEYGDEIDVPVPDDPVVVRDEDGYLTVGTAALELLFKRDVSRFLPDVVLGGPPRQSLIKDSDGVSLSLADGAGNEFSSAKCVDPPSLILEESGPVRACVAVKGFLGNADGRRVCPYTLRFHVYAGSGDVRVLATTVFDQNPDAFDISRLSLHVPASVPAELRVAVGAEETGEGATTTAQTHWAQNWQRAVIYQPSDQQYQVSLDGKAFAAGKRCSGWVALSSDTAGIAVAVRDMWKEYPKAVLADASGSLRIDLWPEQHEEPLHFETPWKEDVIRAKTSDELAEKLKLYPTADIGMKGFLGKGMETGEIPPEWAEGNQSSLEEGRRFVEAHAADRRVFWGDCSASKPYGVAKTHELRLRFNPGRLTDEDVNAWAAVVGQPPLLPPDPAYTCGTGVLRICHPADHDRFHDTEDAMELMFDACLADPIENERLYGMIDYGDLVNGHGRLHGLVYRMFRDHPNVKITDKIGWMNNEANDVCDNIWLAYARTGRRKYFTVAEAYAEHLEDIDTTHVHPTNQRWVGLIHYHNMLHWSAGPSPSHTQIHGYLLHYFLTGNRRALEVSREAADWALRNLEPAGMARSRHGTLRREFSGPMSNLWAFYAATWEEKYGDAAKRSLAFLLGAQDSAEGGIPRGVLTGGADGTERATNGPPALPTGANEHYAAYDALRYYRRLTEAGASETEALPTGIGTTQLTEQFIESSIIAFADWCLRWYDESMAGSGPGRGRLHPAMSHGTYIHPLMTQGLPSFWMAMAYELTGLEKYLAPLKHLLSHIPEQAEDDAAMTGRTPFQQTGFVFQVCSPAMAALAKSNTIVE